MSLYLSLIIFGLGLIYRIGAWFRHDFASSPGPFSPWRRFWAAMGGTMATFFSGRILILAKTLLLDVFWQRRILRESPLRWVMHLCLFWGFTLLLLMHALEGLLAARLFENYASTLNPFLFLRNFFALMVFVGIGIAVYRRFFLKSPRFFTNAMDRYAVIILAVIMISATRPRGQGFQETVTHFSQRIDLFLLFHLYDLLVSLSGGTKLCQSL